MCRGGLRFNMLVFGEKECRRFALRITFTQRVPVSSYVCVSLFHSRLPVDGQFCALISGSRGDGRGTYVWARRLTGRWHSCLPHRHVPLQLPTYLNFPALVVVTGGFQGHSRAISAYRRERVANGVIIRLLCSAWHPSDSVTCVHRRKEPQKLLVGHGYWILWSSTGAYSPINVAPSSASVRFMRYFVWFLVVFTTGRGARNQPPAAPTRTLQAKTSANILTATGKISQQPVQVHVSPILLRLSYKEADVLWDHIIELAAH